MHWNRLQGLKVDKKSLSGTEGKNKNRGRGLRTGRAQKRSKTRMPSVTSTIQYLHRRPYKEDFRSDR